MLPRLLLLVPAALLALSACSPRPPDANPDSPGRSAAAAVRGDVPGASPRSRSTAAVEREVAATRPAPAGLSPAEPKTGNAPARNPATAMGAGPAPRGPGAAAVAALPMDDAQLTARVRTELAAARDLADVRIDVDARDGVVTLSGAVRTAAAKARASEIARAVRGVVDVNDQLTLATS